MRGTIPKDIKASPSAKRGSAKKSDIDRANTIQQFVEIARSKAEEVDPSVLKRIIARWTVTQAATAAPCPPAKQQLIQALAQGRVYTPQESLLLELETQKRAFVRRSELLQGALTTSEVAERLGTGRQTPHDRLHSKTLLAVMDGGRLKFPYWQFDPNGPNGVIRGFPEVLRALDVSDLSKVSWFTKPNPYLEGRTPLETLQAGEIDRVVDEARAVGWR